MMFAGFFNRNQEPTIPETELADPTPNDDEESFFVAVAAKQEEQDFLNAERDSIQHNRFQFLIDENAVLVKRQTKATLHDTLISLGQCTQAPN